jgi:hypothetical protein
VQFDRALDDDAVRCGLPPNLGVRDQPPFLQGDKRAHVRVSQLRGLLRNAKRGAQVCVQVVRCVACGKSLGKRARGQLGQHCSIGNGSASNFEGTHGTLETLSCRRNLAFGLSGMRRQGFWPAAMIDKSGSAPQAQVLTDAMRPTIRVNAWRPSPARPDHGIRCGATQQSHAAAQLGQLSSIGRWHRSVFRRQPARARIARTSSTPVHGHLCLVGNYATGVSPGLRLQSLGVEVFVVRTGEVGDASVGPQLDHARREAADELAVV